MASGQRQTNQNRNGADIQALSYLVYCAAIITNLAYICLQPHCLLAYALSAQ